MQGEQSLALSVIVSKTERTLSLTSKDRLIKTYHIDIGDAGLGDKQRQGDHKTPEGEFYITQRLTMDPRDEFLGTRWFRLSYPNMEDAERGLATGMINQTTHDQIIDAIAQGNTPPQYTALGGGIGIHGGATEALGNDWTFGCIGMTDSDIEEFFNDVPVGTKVIIEK